MVGYYDMRNNKTELWKVFVCLWISVCVWLQCSNKAEVWLQIQIHYLLCTTKEIEQIKEGSSKPVWAGTYEHVSVCVSVCKKTEFCLFSNTYYHRLWPDSNLSETPTSDRTWTHHRCSTQTCHEHYIPCKDDGKQLRPVVTHTSHRWFPSSLCSGRRWTLDRHGYLPQMIGLHTCNDIFLYCTNALVATYCYPVPKQVISAAHRVVTLATLMQHLHYCRKGLLHHRRCFMNSCEILFSTLLFFFFFFCTMLSSYL